MQKTEMASSQPYFSKSKLITAWQCQKKLYLDKHHPERAEVSSATEAVFKVGNEVGAIAQDLYGTQDSVEVEYNRNMSIPLRKTAELIESGAKHPIFEATFQHKGVLVRVDVLLPEGNGWRAVEVKSSTKVKEVNLLDCAIQLWVMRGVGLPVNAIAVGHIDNQFVYAGDGDYAGLLVEQDVTEIAESLEEEVVALVTKAKETISGTLPDISVGRHCDDPYACEFRSVCWPTNAKYPVMGIGGSKDKIIDWVNRGIRDIREVPVGEVTAAKQRRVHRVTSSGEPEVLEGGREVLKSLTYPRYYLDFETAGPAIPIWAGTRPYQSNAVQWSIHIDDGSGGGSLEGMRHAEFLDLSGNAPMRPLAERMIECLGDSGPVLMYTSYEKTVINMLIEQLPDLGPELQKIVDRLWDLYPVVRDHYYHPGMLGSWSIKAAAPAIAPHMDYANLEGINEGMAASEGYLEAIRPETTANRKIELEQQLLQYCRFDTEAMVEIVNFFRSADKK